MLHLNNQTEQRQQQIRRYLWRLVELGVLLAFLFVVVLVFTFAMKYILPFVIGWIIAVLLIPLVRRLETYGLKRTTSVITTMLSTGAVVIALAGAAIIAIAREATMLGTTSAIQYFHKINLWIVNKITVGRVFYGNLPPEVTKNIQSAISNVLNSVEKWFQSFASLLLNSVTQLPESLFIIVIALITAFFILVNRERMMSRFLAALPPGWSGKFEITMQAMARAFVGSIRVQLILMLVSAVLGILGFWVLGFPYAVILGLLLGIFGIVPILGSAILTVPWALGALAVGDIGTAAKLLIMQIVISLIRHAIEPKILADSVGLDTLSTLFALYVGMKAMGVLGLFLGPIILIGVKSLFATHLFVDFLPQTASVVVHKGKSNSSVKGPME